MALKAYSKSTTQVALSDYRMYQELEGQDKVLFLNVQGQHNFISNFSGFKQTGWREIIKAKGNATTPASGNLERLDCPYSVHRMSRRRSFDNKMEEFTLQGNCYMALYDELEAVTSSIDTTQAINDALTKFLLKCKEAQRQLQAGVALGEIRQTLNLIRNPAKALRDLVTDYVGAVRRDGLRLSPKKQAKYLLNQWLETTFGMLPLISDIEGGYKALIRLKYNVPTKYVKIRVTRDVGGLSRQRNSALVGGYFPVRIALRSHKRFQVQWCGEVKLQISGTGLAPQEAAGLTLSDFVPTAYNLIPYSFLVDYFSNIGDILEAASFSTMDLIWNSRTFRNEELRSLLVLPNRPSSIPFGTLVDWSIQPGGLDHKIESFARVTIPPGLIGLPSLAFKIPGNWSKFLNIGALAGLRVLR